MNTDDLINARSTWIDKSKGSRESVTLGDKRLAESACVPFVIRAWWLREFEESKDLQWNDDLVGSPLWSQYSDPMCDLGGADDDDDI
jgi:hypothetical protein